MTFPFEIVWFYRDTQYELADRLDADGFAELAELLRTREFPVGIVELALANPNQARVFTFHRNRLAEQQARRAR